MAAKKQSGGPKSPAQNTNPKGNKLTSKAVKAVAHKAPERRNENKVRGR
jgi:hypothetical protein